MNIDDLATLIERTSSDREASDLAELIRSWKADATTISDLSAKVERYIDHVGFKGDAIHERIFSVWHSFKDEVIPNIGGMTMNERLYFFGLFSRFEAATERERDVVYAKLEAQR